MIILLDTCEFLWMITADPRLPVAVATAVQSPENTVYLSVVSFWEISVKYSIGKLSLPESPATYVPRLRQQHGIDAIALDELAVSRIICLPPHHKDPFDRMLICQAQAHGMRLASSDPLIRQYPVDLL